jgi:hypothetical protein
MSRTGEPTRTCPACGEQVPLDFAQCWSCGADARGQRPAHFRRVDEVEPDAEPASPLDGATLLLLLLAIGLLGAWMIWRWFPLAFASGACAALVIGAVARRSPRRHRGRRDARNINSSS